MNVLLIGNGGREHAIAWKLSKSPLVSKIFVAPGNGGTDLVDKAENIPIGSSKADFDKLVDFAVKNDVGLVIPGPEQPLVEGITSKFVKVGIPVFGPSEKAAQMEGSKTFSKDFMARHNIPTAAFGNFSDYDEARKYLDSVDHKVVIKASGLAAGKGVLMPETKEEAIAALDQVMKDKEFGSAGDEVVIEECLEGDELSILAFSDGYTVVDLPAAQDHKRAGDGDTGLNTGGMGAYSPAPVATPEVLKAIREQILEPTIKGMRKDGYPFTGVLFTGIMLTKKGPQVLEYNVRFGDPETQGVLGLLKSDLAEIMLACAEHRLDSVPVEINPGYATTVVMSAAGYPNSYPKGDVITIDKLPENCEVFHAGTKSDNGKIVTNGGRVIAVTAFAPTLRESVDLAYKGVDKVNFEGKYNRKDIAHRAFRDADKASDGEAITYESAGVSVDTGNKFVEEIKAKVKSTHRTGADAEIGGFGGLFDLKACGFRDPLLVAATDGVGTKLMIAQSVNDHSTVGIDLVAMSVNDLVVQGAEPLLFLDYYATGKLDLEAAASFVGGVADGCIDAGCALVGGETAEMPGLYDGTHYDVNGTCIGAVERDQVLPRLDEISERDVILGIASSGIHSNGFSLVRRILEVNKLSYADSCPWDKSTTVGKSLLTPTRIYVKQLLDAFRQPDHGGILALANITGGGLIENVPRVLPKNLDAVIDARTWTPPAVFKYLGAAGKVPVDDILKTLNMGIGMVVVVKPEHAADTRRLLSKYDVVYEIGKITKGSGKCVVENTDELYN